MCNVMSKLYTVFKKNCGLLDEFVFVCIYLPGKYLYFLSNIDGNVEFKILYVYLSLPFYIQTKREKNLLNYVKNKV